MTFASKRLVGIGLAVLCLLGRTASPAAPSQSARLEVGLGVRDVTPDTPIWLAGYEARKMPAVKVDQPLLAQALALRNPSGERFVLVALDNCEVSREFMAPVLKQIETRHQLGAGAVMVVSSHSHSTPVLDGPLLWIYGIPAAGQEAVAKYGRMLQAKLAEAVADALADLQPAVLEYGAGRAGFAMNRRQFKGDRVIIGENPDGPVDWDVPVLRIKGTNDAVRAIVFSYACHATTVRGDASSSTGDDWYVVSGDFIGYARRHLEAVHPGVRALFLTGMGADSNPTPRGSLLTAKRHGLELAGAVAGVLNRPMRPVNGPFRLAYSEVELLLTDPPPREQMEKDAGSQNPNVRTRARAYLKLLDEGKPLPKSANISLAVVRLGEDLTFFAMGGEPVVDYGRTFKRLFAADHPWTIGYAYDVPFYVPTARVIKEGGYEVDGSLIYAGYYGPFRPHIEELIVNKVTELAARTRGR